jgi:uncharacterized protein with PQ loop repeat
MLSGSNLPVPSQRPVANDSKLSTEDAVVGQVLTVLMRMLQSHLLAAVQNSSKISYLMMQTVNLSFSFELIFLGPVTISIAVLSGWLQGH